MTMKCILIDKDDNPYKMLTDMMRPEDHTVADVVNWLYVDEAQFLSEEQIDWLATIADCGVNVVCYGLRTDFRGHSFEGSKRLLEMADTIEELKSTCSCGNKAIINARVINGRVTLSGKQVLIGSNETYVPMCRACWRSKIIDRNDDGFGINQ